MDSAVFGGVGLVLASGAVSAVVVLLLRRRRIERHEGDMDAIGFVFAVIGVLYAIVLAFVVIDVWNKMSVAEEHAYREAAALVDVYWYAQSLPDPQRPEIERLCRAYAQEVIHGEWPALRARQRPSLTGWVHLDRLRAAVESSRPAVPDGAAAGDPAAQAVALAAAEAAYDRALAQLDVLSQGRDVRVSAATQGVPAVLWFVLAGGALLTIGFAYLFDVGVGIRLILAVGLTTMVVLVLYAVFQLEFPFSRGSDIGPDAFEFALARFAQISRGG